jgi:lysyl-tRNA synthetase class 2
MITDQESSFDSSMIQKCFYDYTKNVLKVQFQSGQLYEYLNVEPETYQSLCVAESSGKFFIQNIKNKYEYSQLITE